MKTKSHALSLLASIAMIVSLAFLAGCGRSGETSSAKPQFSAEKARFLRRGNAICKRADAEQRMLVTRYLNKGPVAQRWELVLPAVVPPMEKELRELRALSPPGEDEAKMRRILEEMGKGVEDAKNDPLDLMYTDSDPFLTARQLAKRYGLTVCAFSSEVVIRPRNP
ncbi:MAG TPA: hypothetical protein VFP21_08430 [Solirubrobacterales bacterium]|nr:hypothetical protein [Solirubrobacterales bacterium]